MITGRPSAQRAGSYTPGAFSRKTTTVPDWRVHVLPAWTALGIVQHATPCRCSGPWQIWYCCPSQATSTRTPGGSQPNGDTAFTRGSGERSAQLTASSSSTAGDKNLIGNKSASGASYNG
jgi:hypothetical protein